MTDKVQPRNETQRLVWNDHHMLLALITAQRSSDPSSQVGAVIVDTKNRIRGLGYNGPPHGLAPNQIPWEREGELHKTKYAYIVHAEKNAIINAYTPVTNYTLFVTMHPCNECAKDIIQAGIKEVVYLTNPYHNKPMTIAAKQMLANVDIELRQFKWSNSDLVSTILTNLSPH